MKNNLKLKKYYFLALLISLLLSLTLVFLISLETQKITRNYNLALASIINKVKEKYPNISDNELINILNSSNYNEEFSKKYSIDITKESIILQNNSLPKKFNYLNFTFIFISLLIIISLFRLYFQKRTKELDEITNYLQELNNQNYTLKLESMSEDELSKLRNEIYKTTIMLKENALNSKKDKLELKKSLEDISHQLKTPLTSIMIMVDNLIDQPSLSQAKKMEYLRNIKREITNMKFLIINLLKLSKLEVNMINFQRKNYNPHLLVNESIKNVLALCDLKNTKIKVLGKCQNKILCDKQWQVEALTNILKNAIEHSQNNHQVLVKLEENNLYTEIKIINYGKTLSKEEKQHLFTRFYHHNSSLKESMGIGLSLAKAIILKDNGKIAVESLKNETTFIIRYFY